MRILDRSNSHFLDSKATDKLFDFNSMWEGGSLYMMAEIYTSDWDYIEVAHCEVRKFEIKTEHFKLHRIAMYNLGIPNRLFKEERIFC